MKQIDLEPESYRVSGRDRIVRSILHKPVFMTIATILGVWVAVTLGVVFQYDGFARVPSWAFWTLYPSLALFPAFFVFVALMDEDRFIAEGQEGGEQSYRHPAQLGQRLAVPTLPRSEDYRDAP